MLHVPAAMFMWFNLARVVDGYNEEEASTKLLFAHLLDNIVSLEFPRLKFALKVRFLHIFIQAFFKINFKSFIKSKIHSFHSNNSNQ
jgi:hypothetical protein